MAANSDDVSGTMRDPEFLQRYLDSFCTTSGKMKKVEAASSSGPAPAPDVLGENGMPAHSSTCGNPGPNSNEGFLLDFFVMSVRTQRTAYAK